MTSRNFGHFLTPFSHCHAFLMLSQNPWPTPSLRLWHHLWTTPFAIKIFGTTVNVRLNVAKICSLTLIVVYDLEVNKRTKITCYMTMVIWDGCLVPYPIKLIADHCSFSIFTKSKKLTLFRIFFNIHYNLFLKCVISYIKIDI